MTVEVSMVSKTAKDAVVVPTAAIFKNAEGADYVLLARIGWQGAPKNSSVGSSQTPN